MKRKDAILKIRVGLFLAVSVFLLVGLPVLLLPDSGNMMQEAPVPAREMVSDLLGVHVAQAASVAFDLCASDGTITLPDSTNVAVWGFVDTGGGPCTAGLANSLPGPELRVNAGDTVTINLSNALAENVSLLIPGQSLTATGGTPGLFAAEATANGGTVSYSFTALEGSYLYESGTNASIQIPMGLYGALVVDSGVTGQAYGYAFNQEAVLLLSEIDPNLNANPGGFDLLDYHPTYWLINGAAYPDTDTIAANAGEQVLLRYLNAGFDHPSMILLGAYQQVIAKEAYVLNNPFDVVAETIPAGTTADMIVDTTGLGDMSLALYNRNMYVTNADSFPGGMLMFIDVADTGTPPTPTPTPVPATPTDTPVPATPTDTPVPATPTDTPVPPTPTDTPVPPTPTDTPAASSHIGDLDGSSTPRGAVNWTATVMVTVHAVDESPVEGAMVTMEATRTRISNGAQVVTTLTCTTSAAGVCSLNQSVNSNLFEDNVTFTVTNVTGAASYQPADNHDPDADSDGTTIVVLR